MRMGHWPLRGNSRYGTNLCSSGSVTCYFGISGVVIRFSRPDFCAVNKQLFPRSRDRVAHGLTSTASLFDLNRFLFRSTSVAVLLVPISATLLYVPTWAALLYLSTSATLLNVPSLAALLLVLTSVALLPSRLWLCCFHMWA